MLSLGFVILLLAAICFLLAALGVKSGRVNLLALGLLLWLLVTMFGGK
jgi:hypothetical protein